MELKPLSQTIITVRKTGRGVRVWQEGSRLLEAGFERYAPYTRLVVGESVIFQLDDAGTLKVAGKTKPDGSDQPIIDFSAKSINGFVVGDQLQASYFAGRIELVKI